MRPFQPLPLENAIFFAMSAVAGVATRPKAARPLYAPPAHQHERHGDSLKILIATDACAPQVNGVVRTLETVARELRTLGHEVRFATPANRTSIPLPTYPDIRLALFPKRGLMAEIDSFRPDAIHIATEGPMGFSARAICIERGFPFTTSFHTRFQQYVHARFPFISEGSVMAALRHFHAPARTVMAATPSLKSELEAHGFQNVRLWSRGVDAGLFKPGPRDAFERLGLSLPRPIFLNVGRVAVEKNIEAFLRLDLPGTKVVVGDGPARAGLERSFPKACFLGARFGAELASIYASSDVFVFPSRTDTFGLTLLEALSCGIPVAAFPVQAPLEVIGNAPVAVLDEDLRGAALRALSINRDRASRFAQRHSWRASAEQFLGNLAVPHAARYAPDLKDGFKFSETTQGGEST